MFRADGRRLPAIGAVTAVAVVAGALGAPIGQAEPAPAAGSDAAGSDAATGSSAAGDLERAKDRYAAAEAEMARGDYAGAVRDYGESYALSKDPALLFKLGHAHEKAGQCDLALVYYERYLRDGQPTERFRATTQDRVAACGGGSAAATSSGSGSQAGSASGSAEVPTAASAGSGSGSAVPLIHLTAQQKAAWVLTGSALALVTIGGVLAYASKSSENDVRDLYAGFDGAPVTFNASTQQRYQQAIDDGHRYQHLAWAAFGAAGGAAIAAGLLFVFRGTATPPEHAQLAPMLSPHAAGLSLTF